MHNFTFIFPYPACEASFDLEINEGEGGLSEQFIYLLCNLKAYLLQGSGQDKDNMYFQYHVGRILKLIHKLLEKDDLAYSSSIIAQCYVFFKETLQIMKDYTLRLMSGE